MTKFHDYLIEKRTNNVIIVDVQPSYKDYLDFNMHNFIKWLTTQRNILMFFNGPEMGFEKKKPNYRMI